MLKRVDSYCENYEQMCSQAWGIVLYFLGLMPSRAEWEASKQLQELIPDLPTWMYHIQAMAAHYQRLQREKNREDDTACPPGKKEKTMNNSV